MDDFVLYGHPCPIYSVDGVGARNFDNFTNNRRDYLINYYEDYEKGGHEQRDNEKIPLFMSRYDVRTLLDETSLKKNEGSFIRSSDEAVLDEEDEIHFERYRDLPNFFPEKDCSWKPLHCENECEESGQNMPREQFLGTEDDHTKNVEAVPFELLDTPSGMILPNNERVYKIISMTAQKSANAPQFEIVLKAKQTENPDFQFLFEKNDLHKFYEHLKSKEVSLLRKKLNIESNAPQSPTLSDDSSPSGGLNCIADYASSSEEEENEKAIKAKPSSKPPSDQHKVRAKRLKQARELREHFAKKLKET